MNISEFKALSDSIQSDEKFLNHPEARRAYWAVVEPDRKFHHNAYRYKIVLPGPQEWKCHNCPAQWKGDRQTEWPVGCPNPDPIPGSLADAVEMLRQKVAEKWHATASARCWDVFHDAINEVSHFVEWDNRYVCDTSRDRFLIFAAAAGAVEV